MEADSHIVASRPTVSPYRFAWQTLYSRLKWDCSLESWRSRGIIKSWQNRYAGGKAVILCNGPSLLHVDFKQLQGTFCFGLNKINLLFDRTDFRPSAVVAVNPLVIEQNRDFFNDTKLPLFLDQVGVAHVKPRQNVAFLHSCPQAKMARDCSISIQQGYTVTFVAMQLAFHMGFRHIAVVGCDHNFAQKGLSNRTVVSGDKDESHFDPKYFSGGMKWQLPDLAASEYFYSMAAENYSAFGGSVTNCTVGGKLEIFPRLALRDWLDR